MYFILFPLNVKIFYQFISKICKSHFVNLCFPHWLLSILLVRSNWRCTSFTFPPIVPKTFTKSASLWQPPHCMYLLTSHLLNSSGQDLIILIQVSPSADAFFSILDADINFPKSGRKFRWYWEYITVWVGCHIVIGSISCVDLCSTLLLSSWGTVVVEDL